ncbi:hypothetical protein O7630_16680 [Micromonospora sp. WMMD718]|uniref:hypothetical protein n=1 Tax=unclassified Micromonospora TaxID=2617518 RepID=UPI00064BF407|nr:MULTISPECIES: hypothetical protein [unclassified Micromonospora]MDG4752582.1 hypothetical protein [Micromonospora sp. WMMD718]
MTAPEEEQEKSAKTDQVLFSPDGDPHHTVAQAGQPDEHLPSRYVDADGATEDVGTDGKHPDPPA